MCLLDRILDYRSNYIEIAAHVQEHAWYLNRAGEMPSWIALEMMAQAAAAYSGLERWLDGQTDQSSRVGMLLGTRELSLLKPTVAINSELRVIAHQTYRDSAGMGAIQGELWHGDAQIATALLKVYELPADISMDSL
ncbi:hypothetical protein DU000_08585 [Parvibium lacunae]|uniref:3-hydroxylacyl-ACP dehydratase n=2 Tax=Parvibium lacunae TaxID=1888893 RepID=A0A368L1Q9_9BURK|nr:hypothetical protein DU000_08585 [Parvibium lacunae]